MDSVKTDYDILLVGNYSDNLNEFHGKLASNFNDEITYKILTYRKTNLPNAYSYEEFLEENFEKLEAFNIEDLNTRYKNTNLYLAVVCERLFVNYYSGTEKTLGNYNLSFEEINFLLKSYTLFLEPFIINSKIIFGGYADNFISTLAFKICENFDKQCLSFHPHWVVNNETCYLNDGIYCKPISLEQHMSESASKTELSHLEKYNNKKHLEEYSKKVKGVKKGIFGIVSPNILDLKYILTTLKKVNGRFEKYLNLNRVTFKEKFIANIYRFSNRLSSKLFYKKLNFKFEINQKYIYFPLQFQPEASTGSRTPFLMNQLAAIENISKSLPLGYKLLVKEHSLSIGMNDKFFYKKIKSLPNVEIEHFTVDGKELLKKTELSIGYGGTTLFEAITFGKKVVLLADDYIYCESILVRKIVDLSQLKELLQSFIDFNPSENQIRQEKEQMITFFKNRGFSLYNELEKNIAKHLTWLINEK